MKTLIQKSTALLLTFAMIMSLCSLSVSAEETADINAPSNGIPKVIIHIDEDAGGEYKTIKEMNESENHSVKCTGTVEIKTPDGYKSEYGDYKLPDEPLKLDFIRGRGNTTWNAVKKPYKLKFQKKADLFGMGESKNYELIANAFDPTLLKNRITYWLCWRMGG